MPLSQDLLCLSPLRSPEDKKSPHQVKNKAAKYPLNKADQFFNPEL